MPAPARVDLFRRYRSEYVAPKQPRLIQIAPAQYLIIAASKSPDCPEANQDALALYALAGALRTINANQRE